MNPPGAFKDLFGGHSADYARFRPQYPEALFGYLASLTPGHSTCWDCGTGNGQAAVKLVGHFERVIATDPSEKQLARATPHPQVDYRVASAEKTTFAPQSVDLITVAQAFHWFKQDAFFAEAKRVLRSQGVLAFWCYELCVITPEVDAVVLHLYKNILGPYWEPERKQVDEGYRSVRMPLEEITPPAFQMTAEWSLEHLIGYLGTWSAFQSYLQRNLTHPLEAAFAELHAAWGEAQTRTVRWPLALRLGRK